MITSYLTVRDSFGSSDRIRSPRPRAIASPPASVTANAVIANTSDRRIGLAPSVRNTAATISDGLSESGAAIKTTAIARAGTVMRFERGQDRCIIPNR